MPPIRFNLSNTRGLIACLVALDRDVGVDVEDTERASSAVDIADRFFSPGEVRALRALPQERQRARFFEYWTLKESYIKARGMGLAIPLDQFSFHLDDGPAIGISFDPRLGDDRSAWQFALYQPSARHTMAAAIRSGGGPPLSIELRRRCRCATADERRRGPSARGRARRRRCAAPPWQASGCLGRRARGPGARGATSGRAIEGPRLRHGLSAAVVAEAGGDVHDGPAAPSAAIGVVVDGVAEGGARGWRRSRCPHPRSR